MVSVERGYDPRSFSLIAFGGAGPMHACAIAEDLAIRSIVVPTNPGLFSALGLLVSDVVHSYLAPVMKTIDSAVPTELEDIFNELQDRGRTLLEKDGFTPEQMIFARAFDARYVGQSYELTVPTQAPLTVRALEQFVESFHEKHTSVYGYSSKDETIEIVNARLNATGLVKKPRLRSFEVYDSTPSQHSLSEKRQVFFENPGDQIECPVYIREKLRAGNKIAGPAVIEQYDSTTVVYPMWNVLVDEYGNLRLTRGS
jgi:N-methylhydantoinase A